MTRATMAAAALAGVVAGVVAGCTSAERPRATPRETRPESSRAVLQQPVPVPGDAAPAGDPVRVQVPELKIDSRLDHLDVDPSGQLATPRSFTRAAWYAGGIRPGDTGPAVIVGHVDSRSGPAVFFALRRARPGDTIRVTDTGGAVRSFVVTAVRRYAKTSFATSDVYGPTVGPQLRLITCTGSFDTAARSYRDNLVVFAQQPQRRAG